MLKIVVLISGYGSNLQAILDAINEKKINAEVIAIISNRTKAKGLQRAREHQIPAYVIPNRKGQSREDYDTRLSVVIQRLNPDLIVLAGFMRIFTEDFVNQFTGKLINIHPSILPKYKGLDTHQRAIDAGDTQHGCSVHFVTPELDGGPVVAQAIVSINKNDNIESLSAKVQTQEHKLYPLVIEWLANKQLELREEKVILNGEILIKPHRI